ncbi:hypothetical protein V6Z12_A06G083400 [Gossypium hirsutum]
MRITNRVKQKKIYLLLQRQLHEVMTNHQSFPVVALSLKVLDSIPEYQQRMENSNLMILKKIKKRFEDKAVFKQFIHAISMGLSNLNPYSLFSPKYRERDGYLLLLLC